MATSLASLSSSFEPLYQQLPSDANASSARNHDQVPQPTLVSEMQQMEVAGQSVSEIASTLGLPQSLVQTDLGITDTQGPSFSAATISIRM